MLMRFDPFRDIERWAQQLSAGTRPALMPVDAYRQGGHWVAAFDLPGVDPGSIDVSKVAITTGGAPKAIGETSQAA
jgi:HSP20 family protein